MQLELQIPYSASPKETVSLVDCKVSPDGLTARKFRTPLIFWDCLRVILLALILPNLITCAKFTALASFFRGWINIEFLIIAALYGFTRRRIFLICILFDLLLDLFEPIAHVYYFNPRDAFEALSYINMIPVWNLAGYTSLVIAYVAMLVAAVRFLMPARRGRSTAGLATALLISAGLLFGFDFIAGRYQVLGSDIRQVRVNLVRTPTLSAAFRVSLLIRPHPITPPRAIRSASMQFLNRSQRAVIASKANFVLILLESWGKMNNAGAAHSLEGAYDRPELRARYVVETGSVPFNGATISGETRELCGQTFPNGIAEANATDLRGCLPNLFARQGYVTVGIDGFHARMYDRRNWYPRVGFSTTLFEEDLDRLGMNTCPGGLVAICDVDIARSIGDRLMQSSASHPLFLHWVTQNSHLPVSNDISGSDEQYCQAVSSLFQDRVLCNWRKLVERVHQSVARIALTESLASTVFVVVGDHAPPFTSTARRAEFSQTEVPYVVLTPRNIAIDPSSTPEHQAKVVSHRHSAAAS